MKHPMGQTGAVPEDSGHGIQILTVLLLPIGYLDIGLKQVGGEMVQEFGDAVFADGAEEVSLGELSQHKLILEFRFSI